MLLWGASMVKNLEPNQRITEDIVNLKDFVLDVVVYAKDSMQAHSPDVLSILNLFSQKRSLNGTVPLETHL